MLETYVLVAAVLAVAAWVIYRTLVYIIPIRRKTARRIRDLHTAVSTMVHDGFAPLGFVLKITKPTNGDCWREFVRGKERIRVLYDARDKIFQFAYSVGDKKKECRTYAKIGGVNQQTKLEYLDVPDWQFVLQRNVDNGLSEKVAREILSECKEKIEGVAACLNF